LREFGALPSYSPATVSACDFFIIAPEGGRLQRWGSSAARRPRHLVRAAVRTALDPIEEETRPPRS
jgi:hypothetical protein